MISLAGVNHKSPKTMSYEKRLELYREISELRQRPVVVYVTSSRQNASGQIGADVIPQFAKLLMEIPGGDEGLDILIVSNGGDPIVPWRIISMMREKYKKIGALLPYAAYSAATLLALGADEIIMHPFSNLGPVDPQLTYQRRLPAQPAGQDVEIIHFGSEDLRNFLDFVRSDVGISDQEQLERAFELVCKDVGAIPIGVAKRSTQLALSMSEKLLSIHLEDASQARAIAEALNRSFYHHGYPLGMSEAKKIGLPVTAPPKRIEEILWQIWQDIEEEMECNRPFNPVEVVLMNEKTSTLLGPVPQIQLPANLPPQIIQEAVNRILQQIVVVQVPPVDYNLFQATLECYWCKSEFRTSGKISAIRLPDMNIAVSMVQTSSGWTFTKNQTAHQEVAQ